MAVSDYSLIGHVLCQTQRLQVTSFCQILTVFEGSHHVPLGICSEKKLKSNNFFHGGSQHNIVKT